MKYASKIAYFQRFGRECPDSIPPKPRFDGNLGFVWDAFRELSTTRQIGFGGVGPIPFTAIDAYAQRYGVTDPDFFDHFRRLIREMDDEFIANSAKKKGDGGEDLVDVDDVDGVRDLLRRANAAFLAKKQDEGIHADT